MFDTYQKYKGNSYVFGIVDVMRSWEELSGEDVPVVEDKSRK